MYTLADYDYTLPEDRIAQAPAAERASSRLLKLARSAGSVTHHHFHDIEEFLRPGDVLVVNNTRVIPGRLLGKKTTGGKAEVLILDYAGGTTAQAQTGRFECRCLIKASKGSKAGTGITFEGGLTAEVLDVEDGVYTVRFDCETDVHRVVQKVGRMPLPPYIKRRPNHSDEADRQDYQTVYASQDGAIAAPTAGLHFTPDLLGRLETRGVAVASLTLHVGYGTFLPVRATDIRNHRMHAERYTLSEKAATTINTARENGGRVVAVGTTSVRTIEHMANQTGNVTAGSGECRLFIFPGYQFKAVDAMITNFHLPQSTLLMLVSAFAGRDAILAAYQTAIQEKYRFYSYGDAMLII